MAIGLEGTNLLNDRYRRLLSKIFGKWGSFPTSLKVELKMELRDMRINSRTEGGTCEVSFGYHSNPYGYTALMSDIMKLYAIRLEDE